MVLTKQGDLLNDHYGGVNSLGGRSPFQFVSGHGQHPHAYGIGQHDERSHGVQDARGPGKV